MKSGLWKIQCDFLEILDLFLYSGSPKTDIFKQIYFKKYEKIIWVNRWYS